VIGETIEEVKWTGVSVLPIPYAFLATISVVSSPALVTCVLILVRLTNGALLDGDKQFVSVFLNRFFLD
jgi:hypothetical protein